MASGRTVSFIVAGIFLMSLTLLLQVDESCATTLGNRKIIPSRRIDPKLFGEWKLVNSKTTGLAAFAKAMGIPDKVLSKYANINFVLSIHPAGKESSNSISKNVGYKYCTSEPWKAENCATLVQGETIYSKDSFGQKIETTLFINRWGNPDKVTVYPELGKTVNTRIEKSKNFLVMISKVSGSAEMVELFKKM